MSFRRAAFAILLSLALGACGPASLARHESKAPPPPKGIRTADGASALPGSLALSADGRIWELTDGRWTRLTSGPNDSEPVWDRSGRQVLFVRRFTDYSDLFAVNPRTKKLTRWTQYRGHGKVGSRQFADTSSWALEPSPLTASSALLLTDRNGFYMKLAVVTRGSKGLRALTDQSVVPEDPQASPNGRRMAYLAHPDGPAELVVRNIVGAPHPKQLTRFPNGVYDPAWSADGRWIFFVASTKGSSNLYAIGADGKKLTMLSSGDAVRQPTAAGRNRIVYLRKNGDGWDVWTARLVTRKGRLSVEDEQQVTDGGKLDAVSNLSWTDAKVGSKQD